MIVKSKQDWTQLLSQSETFKELLNVIEENEWPEALSDDIDFGTGGMRGILGPGSNRINHLTIRRVLLAYIKFLYDISDQPSVVIGYDTRAFSKAFAHDCADFCASKNVTVTLFSQPRPTPQCAFAVSYFQCTGGIMLTASHNPKEDHGIKFYDKQGCQLTPPHIEAIKRKLSPEFTTKVISNSFKHTLIDSSFDDVYCQNVRKIQYTHPKSELSILYTPLHGTGYPLITTLFKNSPVELDVVKSQQSHDPDFTNAKSLNPEDPDCFSEAIKYNNAPPYDLFVATDPDSDRLGVMVYHDHQYHFLNGNQLGVLFLDYVCANSELSQKPMAINTIVTSDIGQKIMHRYDVKHIATLTGFKYIGEAITTYSDFDFIFGYEESHGFLFADFVRDKDAIQAIWVLSEMTRFYRDQQVTLIDALNRITKDYGIFLDDLQTFVLDHASIEKLMFLVSYNYETFFKKLKVTKIVDYEKSQTNLPKAKVLKLYFNKDWIVIRPSGTEPKCKVYYYTEGDDAHEKMNLFKHTINKIMDKFHKVS